MNPEILAALGGGAGAGQAPQASGGQDSEARPVEILQRMISLAQDYINAEPDDEDKHTMAKVLTTLQSYLAKDQKERSTMMGSSPQVKAMARQSRNYGG